MSKRQGPYLMIEASCQGCEHVHSERYVAQGDSGYEVYCQHPAGRRSVAGTWQTPNWCPLLAEAKRRLAVTLVPDGQAL
jgi:hypothetical protein